MIYATSKHSTQRRASSRSNYPLLVVGLLALMTGNPARAEHATPPTVDGDAPTLIAVWVTADWCNVCSKLKPEYKDLLRNTTELPVLFVKLDMTDDVSKRQAKLLAGALKLDDVWSGISRKVGAIIFVNAQTRKMISYVNSGTGLKSIEKMMQEALKAANTKN